MNIDFGAGFMVRSLNLQEVPDQRSIKSNDSEIQKQNPIWNHKKKRPSNLTFFLLITLTIIFLISGVLSVLASYHEIKIVIDSDGYYYGNVEYRDTYNSIDPDTGLREFTYQVRVWVEVTVSIYRSTYPYPLSTLTLEIYDDGKLVAERKSIDSRANVGLEYTVGDY